MPGASLIADLVWGRAEANMGPQESRSRGFTRAPPTLFCLNHLGVSRCALLDIAGLVLTVRGLDAIDGIRILDIKPDTTGFRPHDRIREPAWMRELMADYC